MIPAPAEAVKSIRNVAVRTNNYVNSAVSACVHKTDAS